MSLSESPAPASTGPGQVAASAYLRLSVTDRCNLRCLYCRRDGDGPTVPRDDTLRYEETLDLVDALHDAIPLRKIRITGGEPLVRAELPTLVAGLRARLPHAELCLTTNGTLLARHARALRAAGLDRINVSFDSTDPTRFADLTQGGSLAHVLAGVRAARDAGFAGTKVNAVLLRSINGARLAQLVRAADDHDCELRFIELMPVGDGAQLFDREYLSADDALARLNRTFEHVADGGMNGTARRHRFRDGDHEITVGFITSVSHPFCRTCDRLRLDCRGRLFTCLRCSEGTDLMTPLRRGDRGELERRIRVQLPAKTPAEGWPGHHMVAIGG
jgi:cyclic pyranopterin phosphate synthase